MLVRKSTIVAASPGNVYDVLRDCESYPRFVPRQTYVRILERTASTWRVEFELLIVSKTRYVLDHIGNYPREIRWQLVSADFLGHLNERHLCGCWAIESRGSKSSELTWEGHGELRGLVVDTIISFLVRQLLPSALAAFRREIENRHLTNS